MNYQEQHSDFKLLPLAQHLSCEMYADVLKWSDQLLLTIFKETKAVNAVKILFVKAV